MVVQPHMKANQMDTLCIFGTRPEAIKMAPLIKKLNEHSNINNKVCVTGQHLSMLNQVLDVFQIRSDFNLQVMTENQDLNTLTAKIILKLSDVIEEKRPDLILVHGDTTTTFAATLAAFHQKIPIAHVEAGLRSGNIHSPWPEEANRKLTSCLADLHFAPTLRSKQNLLEEGIEEKKIYITGNTIIDALHEITGLLESDQIIQKMMQQKFSFLNPKRKLILVTGHRRENFGKGLEQICHALATIAQLFVNEVEIIYPIHLNPNVQQPVKVLLGSVSNIHLIEPVDYLSFVFLMKSSYLILTDSGGVQEEAPSLGKPVLVMREITERPEGIEAGIARLVGTQTQQIVEHVACLLRNSDQYASMRNAINPYGDGRASLRIASMISKWIPTNQQDVILQKEEMLC